MNDDIKNNVSTIATWIYVLIAPYVAQYFTQDQFVALVIAIVGLSIAIYSSKHPNTLAILDNKKPEQTIETEENLINEEYDDNEFC